MVKGSVSSYGHLPLYLYLLRAGSLLQSSLCLKSWNYHSAFNANLYLSNAFLPTISCLICHLWTVSITSSGWSQTLSRLRSYSKMNSLARTELCSQSRNPFQYWSLNSTTGNGLILWFCISVSTSVSSSRVPNPPGIMIKAVAYFTSMTLRTKKWLNVI